MGAMRQWGEVTARDGTIAKLKEQHEKVTADSIKKSTTMRNQEITIEELKGQRTGLRNKVDEVEAIVEARDSEIGILKALVDIRNDEINGLEETQARTREELELARD
jgi:chromosome segregation ATPase